MENDSLDYRVLAVQDMSEITGMRLMPNPAGTPTERARGIRLWRQRLKDGEVIAGDAVDRQCGMDNPVRRSAVTVTDRIVRPPAEEAEIGRSSAEKPRLYSAGQ